MNQRNTNNEIAISYSKEMNLTFFHKLLYFLASVAISFWFICPFFFGSNYPAWVEDIVFYPVIIMIVVLLPKHYYVISKNPKLRKILYNPFLSTKCGYMALKPQNSSYPQYFLLSIMYYLSIFMPIICFGILVVFYFIPQIRGSS